jgi:hypothetical protein
MRLVSLRLGNAADGCFSAANPAITWANDIDLEVQTKRNILILHDARQATNLVNSTPVLCAGCHYSPALDLAGTGPQGAQVGRLTFSVVMHRFHGELPGPVFPPGGPVAATCYQCHPGSSTQCQRGAMKAQRARPDDDVINPVLVEQLDQISEVLLNSHGIDL